MKCILALLLLSAAVFAQNTASITGRVLDPSGAVVPVAKITLQGADGSGERETQTDAEGNYRYEALATGQYSVTAHVSGFTKEAATVRVAAGQRQKADIVLRAAAQAQQVTVTATRSVEAIAAVPGSVSVVDSSQLEQQMGLSRNIADTLGRLVPGMPPSSQAMSIYGQSIRGRNYAVLIDGVPQSTGRNVRAICKPLTPPR